MAYGPTPTSRKGGPQAKKSIEKVVAGQQRGPFMRDHAERPDSGKEREGGEKMGEEFSERKAQRRKRREARDPAETDTNTPEYYHT